MSREETFNATKASFGVCGGLFKDTAQEIGKEKALELYGKQGNALGEMLAGMVKEQLGDKELDMKTFGSVMSGAYEGFGITSQIEETPTHVKVTVHQCPVYDAFKAAGLDHGTIEAMCGKMTTTQYAQMEKVLPGLKAELTFRSQPDAPCVEDFHLEK